MPIRAHSSPITGTLIRSSYHLPLHRSSQSYLGWLLFARTWSPLASVGDCHSVATDHIQNLLQYLCLLFLLPLLCSAWHGSLNHRCYRLHLCAVHQQTFTSINTVITFILDMLLRGGINNSLASVKPLVLTLALLGFFNTFTTGGALEGPNICTKNERCSLVIIINRKYV